MEDEVDAADGEAGCEEEAAADEVGDGVGDAKDPDGEGDDEDVEFHGVAHGEPAFAHEVVEPVHGVGFGSVGADVFGAAESFFEEAKEGGFGGAGGFPTGDDLAAQLFDDADADGDDGGDGEADLPAFDPEHDDDAEEEEQVAEEVDDELAKELGKLVDVAVDALDEFTWGVSFVEGEVEFEHVQGEVGTQLVGGDPADVFANICRGEEDGLLDDGDGDEECGCADEFAGSVGGGAFGGGVYKVADDLGVDEREGYGPEDERGE